MPNAPRATPDEPASRVLVVVDDSSLGAQTAAIGTALASAMGAGVVFHYPVPDEGVQADNPAELKRSLAEHREAAQARAQSVLEGFVRAARKARVPAETTVTVDELAPEAICRVALEQGCSLIVVGSERRGTVTRLLRGDLVDELVRLSDRPVLVCREDMSFGAVAPGGAPG